MEEKIKQDIVELVVIYDDNIGFIKRDQQYLKELIDKLPVLN